MDTDSTFRELIRRSGLIAILQEHLASGGSPCDATTGRLYREFFSTARRPIDQRAVMSWAEQHATLPAAATRKDSER